MQTLPPLKFEPLLKRYLWGGRRLGTLLGKPIGEPDGPDANDWAESWEVVDHHDGQSIVADGPLAGATLADLVGDHRDALFGKHSGSVGERFPLLFKLLDANRTLSVQVHPNDAQAARLDPPDLGKTEAWVVLAADPGAKIYAGLREGVDRGVLAAALQAGACDECLHAFEPTVGDCVFIPAGTVHALGEGLVIAEIQQASNTTFRLFDWNRVDKDGKPRPLHLDQSLDVTDYARGPVAPQTPEPIGDRVERLVACEKFVLDRHTLAPGESRPLEQDNRFHLFCTVAGDAKLQDPAPAPLPMGGTILLPAKRQAGCLTSAAGATVLDMFLP